MRYCHRCAQDKEVSAIGAALVHFVCDECRNSKTGWEFNNVRLDDMEYQSPEPKQTSEENVAFHDFN